LLETASAAVSTVEDVKSGTKVRVVCGKVKAERVSLPVKSLMLKYT
jgi:hypothetical protein